MSILRCTQFEVDADNRRFRRAGVEVALEPKAFSMVLVLMSRPNSLITRDQILDRVWGHRYVTQSTVSRVIALARRAFDDDCAQPRYIQTIHGCGYRFIGHVETGDCPMQAARLTPTVCFRVPAQVNQLIGREHDLIQLTDLFKASRAVTILGAGGVGKTQYALEFATHRAADYPDGIWFFDLSAELDADDWLKCFAMALGIEPGDRERTLANIAMQFAERTALFVVDGCDRISVGMGAILLGLLRQTRSLKVLATSQQQLNFVGEHLIRLPPLGLPDQVNTSTSAGLKCLESVPAVAMLLARIRAIQPSFRFTNLNANSVVEICRQLDGVPLALELVATRFALLSAEQVLERLQDRFLFLINESAGRQVRHRNLLALLEWSFHLLSRQEQRLLNWLSVCEQGFTVEIAICLGRAQGLSATATVDLLSGLINKSLLQSPSASTPARYRLLASIREYAKVRLREASEEDQAREAYLHAIQDHGRRMHPRPLRGQLREWLN